MPRFTAEKTGRILEHLKRFKKFLLNETNKNVHQFGLDALKLCCTMLLFVFAKFDVVLWAWWYFHQFQLQLLHNFHMKSMLIFYLMNFDICNTWTKTNELVFNSDPLAISIIAASYFFCEGLNWLAFACLKFNFLPNFYKTPSSNRRTEPTLNH